MDRVRESHTLTQTEQSYVAIFSSVMIKGLVCARANFMVLFNRSVETTSSNLYTTQLIDVRRKRVTVEDDVLQQLLNSYDMKLKDKLSSRPSICDSECAFTNLSFPVATITQLLDLLMTGIWETLHAQYKKGTVPKNPPQRFNEQLLRQYVTDKRHMMKDKFHNLFDWYFPNEGGYNETNFNSGWTRLHSYYIKAYWRFSRE